MTTLIEAGAILNVFILENDGGQLHFFARRIKQIDHRLVKTGSYHQFKTIDAAAKLVRQLSINSFVPLICSDSVVYAEG